MGYKATVLKVFIASPGDTTEERNQIENTIHKWNDLNSEREKVILLPIRWENSISPEYSVNEDGQELINKRILLNSDIVVMIIKSKLGSPTDRAESGTLEELNVFSKQNADKIGIFFCTIPAPTSIKKLSEYQKVVEFKEKLEIEKRGIYGIYEKSKIENFLTRQVAKYTTRIEIEMKLEQKESEYIEQDNSSTIINYIKKNALLPDEVLLLNFMYTEGYNIINVNTEFIYDIYNFYLKQYDYKYKYANLLEHTCSRLFERNILESLGIQEYTNPHNYEIEEFMQYKMNIKTYDELGNILKEYKEYFFEMLNLCKETSFENNLPF